MLYLFIQMMLPFHFSSAMFARKSFKFSITAISLSYDLCNAFQNKHVTFVGNFLYVKSS